jgi:hypothetical protein
MVELLQPSYSRRVVELMGRMQTAIQANRDFFVALARRAKPGEPLPYHPKMKITQAEYEELLAGVKTVTLIPVGSESLHVARVSRDVFRFAAAGALAPLDGLELDLAKNELRTPLGACALTDTVAPSPDQTTAGPWRGFRWKRSEGSVEGHDGSTVQLSLGRLEQEEGRGFLYYNATHIQAGTQTQNDLVVAKFSLARH